MIGIFHDPEELELLADEILNLERPECIFDEGSGNHCVDEGTFMFQVKRESVVCPSKGESDADG